MRDLRLIEATVTEALGEPFRIRAVNALVGGCISRAFRVSDGRRTVFVKENLPSFCEAFESEAQALREIGQTNTLRVPQVLGIASSGSAAYLILEYIEPGNSERDWEGFGQRLAAMHALRFDRFGWTRDNFIGATPQVNRQTDNWIEFWRVYRLGRQFELCRNKGFQFTKADALLHRLEHLLAGHDPRPSLLHGDLWSGNAAFDADGQAFVYDPASYWGDRETDLAFSAFFGGFPSRFYDAYQEALPLDIGYEHRMVLYNLYHCLNHAYLFGASYARQAEEMIQDLLRA